jgi:hypothetical protein
MKLFLSKFTDKTYFGQIKVYNYDLTRIALISGHCSPTHFFVSESSK